MRRGCCCHCGGSRWAGRSALLGQHMCKRERERDLGPPGQRDTRERPGARAHARCGGRRRRRASSVERRGETKTSKPRALGPPATVASASLIIEHAKAPGTLASGPQEEAPSRDARGRFDALSSGRGSKGDNQVFSSPCAPPSRRIEVCYGGKRIRLKTHLVSGAMRACRGKEPGRF